MLSTVSGGEYVFGSVSRERSSCTGISFGEV